MKKEKECPIFSLPCPFATDIAIMKRDISWIKWILGAIAVPSWLSLLVLILKP